MFGLLAVLALSLASLASCGGDDQAEKATTTTTARGGSAGPDTTAGDRASGGSSTTGSGGSSGSGTSGTGNATIDELCNQAKEIGDLIRSGDPREAADKATEILSKVQTQDLVLEMERDRALGARFRECATELSKAANGR